jgi:hypothetical protein
MLRWLVIFAMVGAALFWWLRPATAPAPLPPEPALLAPLPEANPAPALASAVSVPAKTAAPAAKPERDLAWKDFTELFDQLDACELLTKGVANRVPRANLWLFLMRRARTPVTDPVIHGGHIAGLFRMMEEKRFDASRAGSDLDPIQQFFAGIFYAGLADSHPVAKPDYAQASRFFAGAESGHVGNGAVYFFRASAEQLRDPKDFRGILYLQQALKAHDFDTYLTRMARLIWETGLGDPKLFVLSLSLVNRLPHLLYEPSGHELLRSVSERDPERAQLAMAFGQVLMRGGLAGRDLPSGVYWSRDDYDFGRNIARKAWETLNPGYDPSAMERSWPSSASFGGSGVLNPFDAGQFPPRRPDGTCDLDGFRRYVAQLASLAWERANHTP